MTTHNVSVLILNLNTAKPEHCVAAPQLQNMRELPKPVGVWRQFDVTLEGRKIKSITISGCDRDARTFSTEGEKVGLFGVPLIIGDSTAWLSAATVESALAYPSVWALLNAMQGNPADPEDITEYAMDTRSPELKKEMAKPDLRLVGA